MNSEAIKQGGEALSKKDLAANSGENDSSRAAAVTATTAAGNEVIMASAGGGSAVDDIGSTNAGDSFQLPAGGEKTTGPSTFYVVF